MGKAFCHLVLLPSWKVVAVFDCQRALAGDGCADTHPHPGLLVASATPSVDQGEKERGEIKHVSLPYGGVGKIA